MAVRGTHLVTGVTGFVGGAVVLELLARTDAEVLCLVRPRSTRAPTDRLRAALMHAARVYGRLDLQAEVMARCRAVPGDVTEPLCGLDEIAVRTVEQVWHAAGSLLFQEARAQEISRHNVIGTINVLDLARKLSVPCFNHFSTAYVAGRRAGVIGAEPVTDEAVANNQYERSKIVAENAVLAADIDCIRVFRPSIVIGHSRTFAATTFTGLYGFIEGLTRVRSAVRPILGDYLKFRPLCLRGAADTLINFVPVDRVAQVAVNAGLRGGHGIYHLANSCQPVLGKSMAVLAGRLDMMPPRFVRDRSEFSLIDERVDRRLAFYRPYLNESRYFDLTSTREIPGSSVLDFPLPPGRLEEYIDWYLEYQRRKARNANREN
jgi:nucleoside-diphosphate-sugar epimerase